MVALESQAGAKTTAFPYAAIIFDMDGLLLDTETIYTECFTKLLGTFGRSFDLQFKKTIMGLSSRETAELCVKKFNLPIGAGEFQRSIKELQIARFGCCELMPGVRDLITRLQGCLVKLAVATSSMTATFKVKTQPHQAIFAAMKVIVTGDDPAIKKGKPAPDIYLEAARKLEIRPEDCLAFEDSPNGVRAALAAGMHCVWIPDPSLDYSGAEYSDLRTHSSVVTLSSMEKVDFAKCKLMLQSQQNSLGATFTGAV